MTVPNIAGVQRISSSVYPTKTKGYVPVDDASTGQGHFLIEDIFTAMAPEFKPAVACVVGHPYWYPEDGYVYRCTVAHTGAWNPDHFTRMSTAEALQASIANILNAITSEFVPNVATVKNRLYWHDNALYLCKVVYTGVWNPNNFTAIPLGDLVTLYGLAAATEADLDAGSKIPIMTEDGPKALPGNAIAKASDITRLQSDVMPLQTKTTNISASIAPEYAGTTGAVAGRLYMNGGVLYRCKEDTTGDFDVSKFDVEPVSTILNIIKYAKFFDAGNEIEIQTDNGDVVCVLDDDGLRIKSISLKNGNNYERLVPDGEIGTREIDSDSILLTKNNGDFIALIDDEGIHAKDFFIRETADGEDTPVGGDTGSVEAVLPAKIVAVVGDTLQLFYRGMFKCPNPYLWALNAECSIGKNTPRYYEVTPVGGDVGNKTFTLYAKNKDGSVVGSASTTLKVVAVPSSPVVAKKILCFGASNTKDGKWVIEASRRLTGSGGSPAGLGLVNIKFCGGMNNGEGVGWFGVGGWSWTNYTTSGGRAIRFQVTGVSNVGYGAKYTNDGHEYTVIENNTTGGVGNILCSVAAGSSFVPDSTMTLTKTSGTGDATITYTSYSEDVQNPLWDSENNKMSFIPYADAYSDGSVDVVCTMLTWNGISGYMTDFTAILAQVKTFADTLHAEFPNAKLLLMGMSPPSVNGGVGANYGAAGGYYDWYGLQVTIQNMNKAYKEFAASESYSQFVEFVCTACQFDVENNMQQSEKAVNTRNIHTELVGTNGVHPSNDGQLQIADVVYRALCDYLQ